jgi:hexosaminidase
MIRKLFVFTLLFLWVNSQGFAQSATAEQDRLGIIPLPSEVTSSAGSFTFPEETVILAKTTDEVNVASFIQDHFKSLNKRNSISNTNSNAQIQLVIDKSIASAEGYQLTIGEKGVSIKASTGAGLFYGVQTLLQLLPVSPAEKLAVPFVKISDQPTFKWRGSMLDVARHFFPVPFIKKYIDFLAFYKINTFHWHLTDDQGWRIEIKKYPKLTEVSAFRSETLIGAQQQMKKPEDFVYDGIPHGGFYTQEEIKDVVAYAQKRFITIVPEIEMPGHSVAVLAAYPELACKPGNYETFKKWGITEDIVCPTEQTFQFFENVLSEVVTLFPGKYIHIGGDEAPKKVWRESDYVKNLMKKNKIDDVEKVQGWFNSRIEKFLIKKGKKLIGWDEILEGGITPNSTIMSWRGEKGGIEAAKTWK